MRKYLDPKAVWLFFREGYFPIFVIIIIICFILIFVIQDSEAIYMGFLILLSPLLAVFFAYIYARLSWKNYQYEIAPEAFKKELGIIQKKYVSIPYNRIQNVDINRGMLSRILGLSDLQIQTAGMSGVIGSEGHLPGLSQQDAEKLRDELIKKVRESGSKQGL
ncbi:MAG: hypothetical protein UY40_C0001G0037 [candidate division CPR1 bacterium GW2011_GWC1_49_13]|uniref:YdbS-like PH domain-containing protein n=1 Tax=candidate division CPR1 bacterium GW2011_GWC1_49_13 TaxID=1618342 RepID=A0A0G1YIN7_9BACT|nr:MAG: hypothetical protein UY40_C0001G0037 [candidate division CPR1 bacterium GW2011_GWC1_49_13]